MWESIRAGLARASGPICGLALCYVIFILTGPGRAIDALSYHGRVGTLLLVRSADLRLLDLISTLSLVSALLALVLTAGLRGRWSLGVRAVAAVLASLLSSEVLKFLLPNSRRTGEWTWLTGGSFPSGHAVIVVSVSLAVLSVSSEVWRRRLVGPLLAWAALSTTATITVGWHRPSDVIGSFFLATAWQRGLNAGPAAPARPASSGVPVGWWAFGWWIASCALVLGAGLEGVLSRQKLHGPRGLAYLVSLAVLLAGAGITIASASWASSGAARARNGSG